MLKEIFEKNKTTKYKLTKMGSILGFYLSKEIIAAHFGKMVAQSSTDNTNILGFVIPID